MASQPPSTLINSPTILSSKIIEVIAEHGTKHFFVHSAILLAHSPPLKCALTGAWAESTTKRIELPDWDGPTVTRFLQYLYISTYEAAAKDTTDENPLLTHAKLYALADYKDVPPLRKLSLSRLAHALEASKWGSPDEAATADAVELLDYVYAHTRSGEAIRTLVCRFAVEQMEKLMRSEDMEALLGRGGDFTIELMKMSAARAAAEEKKAAVAAAQGEARKASVCASNTEKIQALELRVQALEIRAVTAAAGAMSPAALQRAAAARMSGVRRSINVQIR